MDRDRVAEWGEKFRDPQQLSALGHRRISPRYQPILWELLPLLHALPNLHIFEPSAQLIPHNEEKGYRPRRRQEAVQEAVQEQYFRLSALNPARC